MPIIVDLREDLKEYIQKHGLSKKWERVKTLFEHDPSHPSLKTERLEPKHRLIYSFRIDLKYGRYLSAFRTTKLKSLPSPSITTSRDKHSFR